jgi:hypothetical protein
MTRPDATPRSRNETGTRSEARHCRRIVGWGLLALGLLFVAWRMVRPMNIFTVSDSFARPMAVTTLPEPLASPSAEECAGCHAEIYQEWQTSMHRQAWDDPYYQVDLHFDGDQQICLNCHIPLANQQENLVTGFRDRERWDPILVPNPGFDPLLQHEGVTCLVCHLHAGAIAGPFGGSDAPHAVVQRADANAVCHRCHVVSGARWDTFFRLPPCGTLDEIRTTGEEADCVACHMPAVERPAAAGAPLRPGHRHLWRGGHDPETVRAALRVELDEVSAGAPERRRFALTLTNAGAAHYLPTGTPDRHLTVTFRLLDRAGHLLQVEDHRLRRAILWRPFIVDLWDTRLPRDQPRSYTFTFATGGRHPPATLEVTVRYHLLDEARRRRIGYQNTEPIAYDLFRRRVDVGEGTAASPG